LKLFADSGENRQIEAAQKDVKECRESKKKLQKEWDIAKAINSETTFYR